MQACAVYCFPDHPDTVWALAQPLVGSMGRGLAAPSLPCCHIQRVRSLGWSWKKGWLVAGCDFPVIPERATRGPHQWPGSCLLMPEQGRNCANW